MYSEGSQHATAWIDTFFWIIWQIDSIFFYYTDILSHYKSVYGDFESIQCFPAEYIQKY